jgi:hypothetical protein
MLSVPGAWAKPTRSSSAENPLTEAHPSGRGIEGEIPFRIAQVGALQIHMPFDFHRAQRLLERYVQAQIHGALAADLQTRQVVAVALLQRAGAQQREKILAAASAAGLEFEDRFLEAGDATRGGRKDSDRCFR